MVETIVNAVDEYQVRRSGADIAFKMGSKARNGGTIGRARLGYVNVRDTSGGRNIGTVVLDEERAHWSRLPSNCLLRATSPWTRCKRK